MPWEGVPAGSRGEDTGTREPMGPRARRPSPAGSSNRSERPPGGRTVHPARRSGGAPPTLDSTRKALMSPTHDPLDRGHADDLLAFVRASPSPYHVVASAAQRLEKAGFAELRERDDWTAGAEGGRYVVRAGALLAWYVPPGAPAHTPFRIVGAHTDSPNL